MPFARRLSPSRAGARAFTLLELIVVIVILGVLAGIAIPTFLTSQSKARDAVTSESLAATAHNAAALAALDQAFSDGNFSTAASESNLTALAPGLFAATAASAVAYNSSTGAGYASRPGVNGASGATAFTLSYQISPDKQSAGLAVVAPSGNCLMDVVSLTSNQKPWSYADLGANCNGSVALAGPTQPTPSKVAPGTPTIVTGFTAAVASGTSVNLAWSAPSTGAASYQVTVSPAPQTGGSTQSVSGTATSYQVQNLSPSTSYTFTIVAQNVSNVAGPSASAGPVTTWSAALSSPSGLSASAGSNTVSLSWSAVSNAVSYNVYRGGTFLASSSTPSYTDNTAVNGTTYSYQVSSVDNHGQEGAPSAAVTARPLPAKPGQVTGVSATAGNASVTLSWTALANSASYNVYKGGTVVATVSAPATTYTVTGLSNGTSYSFQVSSVDAYAQEGTPSAAVSATPYTTASAPTALTLTPGQSTMAVSWTAPSSTGGSTISSYTVSISPAPTSGPATQSVSGTSASFANLVASTSYTVSVSAQNAAGSSAATTASATTWNATLSAPSGLTATPGNTTVALSWSAVSGATSYNVYRGGTILTTVTAPTTSYTDSTVTNGTQYSYQVSSVDTHAQESAPSAAVSTTPRTTPSAPTALTLTPGQTSMSVSWSAPSSTGGAAISSYTVSISPAPTSGSATQSVTGTSASFTNLAASTSYTVSVLAVNAAGNGPAATASSTTWAPAPSSPSGLSATPGDSKVVLSWTAISGATSYNVYRGGTILTTVSSPTTSYTDSTAVNGTTYSYQVSSIDSHAQESAPSPAVSATPLPAKPGQVSGLSATAGNASVTLSWTALAGSASYNVYKGGTVVATVSAPATTYTVTGLTNGTSYSFQVSSVDQYAQEGTPSAAVSATPYTTASAPTALTLTPGQSTMAVSWTAPSSTGGSTISSYTVSISPAPTSGPATQSVSGTSASFANLVASTSYTVSVSAQNAAGSSAATTASATTWNATLSSPTNVTATPGNTTVALSWSAVSGATSYNVYRGGTILTTVSAPTTSYTDSTVTNGTQYSYQVSSVDTHAQESAPSAAVSTTPRTTPSAPTALTLTPGQTSMSVSWSAPSSTGGAAISSYTVSISPAPTSGSATQSVSGTTASFANLAASTSYTVSVLAVNAAGNGPAATASSTTWNAPLSSPTNVTATPGNTTVALSWSAVTGATSYNVYRGGTILTTVSSPTTSYTDSAVTNGTQYSYQVSAVDTHAQESAPSAAVLVTPRTTASAPTALTLTPSSSSMGVSWTAPASNGGAAISSYTVSISPAPTSGAASQSVTGTSASFANLAATTSYTVSVVAVNAAGSSAAATASSTTWNAPLSTPSGLAATPGNNTVALSWSAVSGATSYNVYRGGTILASTSSPSYTDNSAVNGTQYSYQVSSIDSHGQESAPSASVSAKPLPAKPDQVTGLSATAGNASVALSWTAQAQASSYNVYVGGVLKATVSAPATTYTVTGLQNGTSYSFQVSSVDQYAQEGTPSAAVSATPYTTSSAPVVTASASGQTTMSVSWTAPASTGGSAISSYTVSISPAPTSGPASQSVTGTSASFANLVANTSYTVSVVAVNGAGSSAAGTASATTWNVTPSAPTNVAATASGTSATISWSASTPAGGTISSYSVYRGGTLITTVSAPTTSYTDTGLSANTTYSYQVSETDSHAQVSGLSGGVSASTVPATPTNVTAANPTTANSVTVSWTGSNAVTTYTVYRNGTSIGSTANTTYTDTTGVSQTTYTYTVSATNSAGTSSQSSSAAAVAGSRYASAVIADAPIGYYRLGESGSSSTAANAAAGAVPNALGSGTYCITAPNSLYTTNGSCNVPSNWTGPTTSPVAGGGTAPHFGGGTYVNGAGFISLPSMPASLPANGFTFEAWVYATDQGSWARILDLSNGPDSDNMILGRDGTTTSVILGGRYGVSGQTGYSVIAGTAGGNSGLSLNTWHHLATTVTATGAATMYVDGTSVATASNVNYRQIARTYAFIARSVYSSSTNGDAYFQGYMAEVAIYPSALTQARVQAHYNAR